jgi:3-dehydroquinate synthase
VLYADKNVNDLYNDICDSNNKVLFEALEKNKTITSSLDLIAYLNSLNLNKNDILISIGGGITQDVSAFTRAIYKRGINWIYFPTTLLSMADSCIGSKSAINYEGSKNLLGLFSAPKEIYIDVSFLNTLKTQDILSGYGEILKLCIVGGVFPFYEYKKITEKQRGNRLWNVLHLIKLALHVKKAVITKDEFEKNIRKALNYGHTIGHAIEPLVDFKIPHGVAVLIGMFLENNVGYKYGYMESTTLNILNNEILKIIDIEFLRLAGELDVNLVISNMKKDKKNEKSMISFAIPSRLGKFNIVQIKNDAELERILTDTFKLLKND